MIKKLLITLASFIFSAVLVIAQADPHGGHGMGMGNGNGWHHGWHGHHGHKVFTGDSSVPPGLRKKGTLPHGLIKRGKTPAGWSKGNKHGW